MFLVLDPKIGAKVMNEVHQVMNQDKVHHNVGPLRPFRQQRGVFDLHELLGVLGLHDGYALGGAGLSSTN